MTSLDTKVPDALMKHIERRAHKLTALIDVATHTSDDKKVREHGAQLIDRIYELLEEVRDLEQSGDSNVHEAIDVFHRRLYLAEKKVDTWNIPKSVKKDLEKKAAPAPKRRGRPKKRAA